MAPMFNLSEQMFFFHLINKNIQLGLRKTPFIYDADVYILCDMLQCNIINVIFAEDGNHYLRAVGRKVL